MWRVLHASQTCAHPDTCPQIYSVLLVIRVVLGWLQINTGSEPLSTLCRFTDPFISRFRCGRKGRRTCHSRGLRAFIFLAQRSPASHRQCRHFHPAGLPPDLVCAQHAATHEQRLEPLLKAVVLIGFLRRRHSRRTEHPGLLMLSCNTYVQSNVSCEKTQQFSKS